MRESPLIILWLDNLGVFYPLIAELGTSLCRILYGRPPDLLQPEADLLFGTQ